MIPIASRRTPIHTSPGGELARVLNRSAAAGESVLVDTGEALYELDVQVVTRSEGAAGDDEPDALLSIIGIGSSDEPTNIARDKDAYLADALDPRTRR